MLGAKVITRDPIESAVTNVSRQLTPKQNPEECRNDAKDKTISLGFPTSARS